MKKIFLIVLFFAQLVIANEEIGKFVIVIGNVQVMHANAKLAKLAKNTIPVFQGDKITTDATSKAKILLNGHNIMNVLPNSVVIIEKYDRKNDGKEQVKIKLIEGKIRNDVNTKFNGESSKFEVHTSNSVIGIRGTKFVTTYDNKTQSTELVTFEGEVQLKSFASLLNSFKNSNANEVLVKAAQRSTIEGKNFPTPPTDIKEPELGNLIIASEVLEPPPPKDLPPAKKKAKSN